MSTRGMVGFAIRRGLVVAFLRDDAFGLLDFVFRGFTDVPGKGWVV